MATLNDGVMPGEEDSKIDIKDIVSTLRRQAWKILAFTVVAMLVAVYLVLFATPKFKSNGSIYLGDALIGQNAAPPQSTSNDINFVSNFGSAVDVTTAIALIKSHALLEQSILESGLNSPVVSKDKQGMRFWKWKLFYGGAISAYGPAPGDVRAVYATFAQPVKATVGFDLTFGENGSYQVTSGGGWFSKPKVILSGVVGQPASGSGLSLMIQPAIAGQLPSSGTTFMLSVSSAQALADALIVSESLKVENGGTVVLPDKLADLTFTWGNPYDAARFVNQVMQNFLATQLSWKTDSATSTEKFVDNELNSVKVSLASADKDLAAYQSQTGIIDVGSTPKQATTELSEYEVTRTSLKLQQVALQGLSDQLAKPAGLLNPYLVSQANDVVLSGLITNLANAQVQMTALRVQFTADSPQVEVLQATISKLQQAVRSTVNNDLQTANDNVAAMDDKIASLQAQMAKMPGETGQVLSLQRKRDVLGQLYVLLMQEKEKAAISEAATVSATRIDAPAEIPLEKSSPSPVPTVLVGLLIGLFGGVGYVLIARTLSGRFESFEDVRRLIKLPLYGVIPTVPSSDFYRGLLSTKPRGVFAEAFRLLRSNIYLSHPAQKSTVIMVISAANGDGKTSVAANLAKALADDNKRVVLVDADLYAGKLCESLQTSQSPGLTEWLDGLTEPALKTVPNERFKVLPSGSLPPNPTELLNLPSFANIVSKFREEFEFVVLDSPPLPGVSDGITLGHHADLILSVISIGHTPRELFMTHIEAITPLGRRHGIVVNSVSGPNNYGGGYVTQPVRREATERLLVSFKSLLSNFR